MKNARYIFMMICAAVLVCCEPFPVYELPKMETEEVKDTEVTATTAVLYGTMTNATIPSNSAVRRGFQVSQDPDFQSSMEYECDTAAVLMSEENMRYFRLEITGLAPATTYYARVWIDKSDEYAQRIYGNTVSFTTEESKGPNITLVLNDIISVTSCTSRTTGTCTAENCTVSKLGILISKKPNPTVDSYTSRFWITTATDFWVNLYNLDPATTYYVRADAFDTDGNIYYSNVRSFTTKSELGGSLTVSDFYGTYTMTAYSPWQSKNVTWTDVQVIKDNQDTVTIVGIDNNENYRVVGIFDKGRQVIRLESNWYWGGYTFDVDGKTCAAQFTPVYYNSSDRMAYHVTNGGRNGHGEIWLQKTGTNTFAFVSSDGDTNLGYLANGFFFQYFILPDMTERAGYSNVYTRVKMTRTSTTTTKSAPARIPALPNSHKYEKISTNSSVDAARSMR